jgi:hypothetical protein
MYRKECVCIGESVYVQERVCMYRRECVCTGESVYVQERVCIGESVRDITAIKQ